MQSHTRIPGLISSTRQLGTGVACFVLTIALLDAGGLAQWAARLDIGPLRAAAVPLTRGWDRVVRPLGTDALRRTALAGLGRIGWSDDPAANVPVVVPAQVPFAPALIPAPASLPVPMPALRPLTRPQPRPATTQVPKPAPAPPSSPAVIVLPPPPPPPPTPAAPLQATVPTATNVPSFTALPPLLPIPPGRPRSVALVGDSMMAVGLSDVLLRETAQDRRLKLLKLFRSGTGLARPDVFDWMQEFPAMLGAAHPDLIIVAIGANDSQSYVDANGDILAFGSAAWEASYRARVTAFMDMLARASTQIIWIGLPPMRASLYDDHVDELNRVTYTVVSAYEDAAWWNPDPYIGAPDGGFRDFGLVETAAGHQELAHLRAPDGIHLSDDGASLLTQVLLPWLEPLPLPPPPAPAPP